MTAWGSICIAHMAVRSSSTFYALRLLLGVAEAGFTPTAYYYMSTFYPKFSLGFRMGMFSGMYAVAGAFAGLLAYGLLHLETSALRGWQLLFLVEGVITVGVALVAATILPTDISNAWFLTEVEKAHALRRMERDHQTTSDSGIGEGIDSDGDLYTAKDDNKITMRDIKDVFMDWKKLLIIMFNILSVLVRFDLVPLCFPGLLISSLSLLRPLPLSYPLLFKVWVTAVFKPRLCPFHHLLWGLLACWLSSIHQTISRSAAFILALACYLV